ncbi:hypothetical protein TNCV_2415521 [Trichonephila clavipes]|nr:hypothetical protein TNCV_2415521 [Trichonephila clavipes]
MSLTLQPLPPPLIPSLATTCTRFIQHGLAACHSQEPPVPISLTGVPDFAPIPSVSCSPKPLLPSNPVMEPTPASLTHSVRVLHPLASPFQKQNSKHSTSASTGRNLLKPRKG